MDKKISLHLISDSTGETLVSVARAVLSQFEGVKGNEFIWPLVRSKSQMENVVKAISEKSFSDLLIKSWDEYTTL